MIEGRGKREEGRRKREEGRGKKEEGRGEHLSFAKSIFFIIVRASPLAYCTTRELLRSHYSNPK